MEPTTVFAAAAALSMDAFAVAVTAGARLQRISAAQTLRLACTFGFFQFLMPAAGWLLSARAREYIESYAHWPAFALLAFVGGKMILDSSDRRDGAKQSSALRDPTSGLTLCMLGVATSLDALAVGASMALLGKDIWIPAMIIGGVCFVFTAAGACLGRLARLARGMDRAGLVAARADLLGGLVLIAIGVGILKDHGVF
jgi:putative Mn2+ efflux pump MntP